MVLVVIGVDYLLVHFVNVLLAQCASAPAENC